jgi:hypothetical protein
MQEPEGLTGFCTVESWGTQGFLREGMAGHGADAAGTERGMEECWVCLPGIGCLNPGLARSSLRPGLRPQPLQG